MIHPTAIIHPSARIASDVAIGPFAVIDGSVEIAPQCWVGPHVHITGATVIGPKNRIHTGAVLGDAPQDLRYKDAPTRLVIGEANTFREYVTVHRSNSLDEDTVIGSNNYFMAASHVGHNSRIGNNNIIANAAMIAGHVTIEDRVFISATAMIHQFVRIGTLVMMQGGSGVSKDVPPFTIATGVNAICGLNVIGLRRAGTGPEERLELKRLYHFLFRTPRPFKELVAEAKLAFQSPSSEWLLTFVETSKRGVCMPETRGNASDESES